MEQQADALVIIHIHRSDPSALRYRVATAARDDERNIVSLKHVFLAWCALGKWILAQPQESDDEYLKIDKEEWDLVRRLFNEETNNGDVHTLNN